MRLIKLLLIPLLLIACSAPNKNIINLSDNSLIDRKTFYTQKNLMSVGNSWTFKTSRNNTESKVVLSVIDKYRAGNDTWYLFINDDDKSSQFWMMESLGIRYISDAIEPEKIAESRISSAYFNYPLLTQSFVKKERKNKSTKYINSSAVISSGLFENISVYCMQEHNTEYTSNSCYSPVVGPVMSKISSGETIYKRELIDYRINNKEQYYNNSLFPGTNLNYSNNNFANVFSVTDTSIINNVKYILNYNIKTKTDKTGISIRVINQPTFSINGLNSSDAQKLNKPEQTTWINNFKNYDKYMALTMLPELRISKTGKTQLIQYHNPISSILKSFTNKLNEVNKEKINIDADELYNSAIFSQFKHKYKIQLEKYFRISHGIWLNKALYKTPKFRKLTKNPLEPASGGVELLDIALLNEENNITGDAILVLDYRSDISNLEKYTSSPEMYNLFKKKGNRLREFVSLFNVTHAKAQLNKKTHLPNYVEFQYEEAITLDKRQSVNRGNIKTSIIIKPVPQKGNRH